MESVRVETDVVYGTAGRDLRCDVYRPSQEAANGAAVLLFHGGGWRAGERGMMKEMATLLAGRGYLAIAPEYRLLGEAPWPAQIQDTKAVARWVRASAGQLGINPDMIALCGFSAGAHLALLAAGTADSNMWSDGNDGANVSDRVAAVIAFFPPVRLEEAAARNLGVSTEAARLASPIEHVSSAFPPVLFFHGTGDNLVPHAQSLQMFDALAAAGVPVDLRLYAGLPHEFVRLPGFPELCAADIDCFLSRHLVKREPFEAALGELQRWWEERRPSARPATAG